MLGIHLHCIYLNPGMGWYSRLPNVLSDSPSPGLFTVYEPHFEAGWQEPSVQTFLIAKWTNKIAIHILQIMRCTTRVQTIKSVDTPDLLTYLWINCKLQRRKSKSSTMQKFRESNEIYQMCLGEQHLNTTEHKVYTWRGWFPNSALPSSKCTTQIC